MFTKQFLLALKKPNHHYIEVCVFKTKGRKIKTKGLFFLLYSNVFI